MLLCRCAPASSVGALSSRRFSSVLGLLLRLLAYFLRVGTPVWGTAASSASVLSAPEPPSVLRLLLRPSAYFLGVGAVLWSACCLVRRRTFCAWVLLCGRAPASSSGPHPVGGYPSVAGSSFPRRPAFCPCASICRAAPASSVAAFSPAPCSSVVGLPLRPLGYFLRVGAPPVGGSCFICQPTFCSWPLVGGGGPLPRSPRFLALGLLGGRVLRPGWPSASGVASGLDLRCAVCPGCFFVWGLLAAGGCCAISGSFVRLVAPALRADPPAPPSPRPTAPVRRCSCTACRGRPLASGARFRRVRATAVRRRCRPMWCVCSSVQSSLLSSSLLEPLLSGVSEPQPSAGVAAPRGACVRPSRPCAVLRPTRWAC